MLYSIYESSSFLCEKAENRALLPCCCFSWGVLHQAKADVCIEQADIMELSSGKFEAGTVVFCYLLPAGLEKLRPMLRETLERRECVLTTLTWPVPGLDDLLSSSSSGAGFHVYCSTHKRPAAEDSHN